MLKDKAEFTPKDKSKIHANQPEISISFSNRSHINNIKKIKMYINRKEVPNSFLENKIFFLPNKPLSPGRYKVKIRTKLVNGKKEDFEWSFRITSTNGKNEINYNFYFGIPHSHTSLSTGKGNPTDALNYAKKKDLDFLTITDHSSHLIKKTTDKSSSLTKWELLNREVNSFNKTNHSFLGIAGFEATSNNYGDFNVINSSSIFRGRIRSLSDFLSWLESQENPIVTINHPHKYIESLTFNERLDKFINLIEVGNGSYGGKYLNCEKYYYSLLDKGWHLGAINAQDNHKFDWGDSDNLTVVLSKSLKKKDLIEALKQRRTYSSETRSLKFTFSINQHLMGSIITSYNKNLDFSIWGEDKKVSIHKIQIITNGGDIFKEKILHEKSKFRWNFTVPHIKNRWYVAKVVHEDGRCGLSSAIFV